MVVPRAKSESKVLLWKLAGRKKNEVHPSSGNRIGIVVRALPDLPYSLGKFPLGRRGEEKSPVDAAGKSACGNNSVQ